MDFQKLDRFLKKASESPNSELRKKADAFLDQLIENQEDGQVAVPEFESKEKGPDSQAHKDIVDQMLLPAFKDLAVSEQDDSTFGKVGSAYTSDIPIKDLPEGTRNDIIRLVPIATNNKAKIVQYGMVVDELLPKVDKHNFEVAEEHVKKDLASQSKRVLGDKFQEKLKDKYILLLNDTIVDGHHFLALAKVLNITCSLRVLDLTPIRFQLQKSSSLLETLRNEQSNYSRKGGTTIPLYTRVSSVFRRERAR
jgi:hypothetical protein